MRDLPRKRCENDSSILPYDVIFKILLLFTAKDLLKLSTVCKTWHRLINSPNFVELHKNRCETVLTFLKFSSKSKPNTFSIDGNNSQLTMFEPASSKKPKLQIHLFEFEDKVSKISDLNICGFGNILATCDGLVLARNKTGTLLVLNPMTRKVLPIKPGTIVPHHEESFGFVFSHHAREYIIVHVFRDKSGHVDSEIFSFKRMSWRGCNVPSFGLFRSFCRKAVAASGVLYWLPGNHSVNYLVSMDIEEEKYVSKNLPVDSSRVNDKLVENGGLLNYIGQMTVYRIQLWTLKRCEGEDRWVKRYTINMDYDVTSLVPVFMTKNGRYLIFKALKAVIDGHDMENEERDFQKEIYEYDMEDEEMKKVPLDDNLTFRSYKMGFPHANTLVSWEPSRPLW